MARFAVILALIAGLFIPYGCTPSGVGSVNWDDSPKARAIGAHPRSTGNPVQNNKRRTQGRPAEYVPG
jgi:hypothetical protein